MSASKYTCVSTIKHGKLPYLSPDQRSELSVSPSAHPRQLSDPPSGGTSSGWLLSFLFVWQSPDASDSPPLLSSDRWEGRSCMKHYTEVARTGKGFEKGEWMRDVTVN